MGRRLDSGINPGIVRRSNLLTISTLLLTESEGCPTLRKGFFAKYFPLPAENELLHNGKIKTIYNLYGFVCVSDGWL